MSKLITDTIRHTGGSADNITLDGSQNVTCEANLQVDGNLTVTGTIPAGQLTGTVADARISTLTASKLTGALPAISGASLTGVTDTLSFRNLIMNGEFIIDQRMGGSATAITPSGGVDYTCDRWHESNYSGEAGRITFQTVSDDVPNGNYRKALKLDCTTAMGTPSGNNWMGLAQFIEAQDVRVLGHGTSAAKSFTLQFWVKSTKTGASSVTVLRHDASREYVAEYTISSSNTWEKKTITIPGDTTGTEAAMDNGRGFKVSFSLFAGSSRHGTLDEWRAQNGGYTGASANQVNLLDSTSNNIFFTGVQLEAGSTATDFEHRSYGEELARCQRYCYAHITPDCGQYAQISMGSYYNASNLFGYVSFPVTMRTKPTLLTTDATDAFNVYRNGGVDFVNNFVLSANESGTTGAAINNADDASGTAGHSAIIRRGASSTNYFIFDSEL